MLVFAFMVIFAFPAIIAATLLLEVERMFHWPFFIARRVGDPLLWQHLFWFFGHPEVYVIFIPAAGFVSMIVPAMARTQLVGYPLVVLALITTGFLSFGLWVHHMFATGIPPLSVSFFSAASMAVAVPTVSRSSPGSRLSLRAMFSGRLRPIFVIGMLVIFVIGGLTASWSRWCHSTGRCMTLISSWPPALCTDRRHGLSASCRHLLLGSIVKPDAALRNSGENGRSG